LKKVKIIAQKHKKTKNRPFDRSILKLIFNVICSASLIFLHLVCIVDSIDTTLIIFSNYNLAARWTFCLNNLCTSACFLEVMGRCNRIPRIEKYSFVHSKAPLVKISYLYFTKIGNLKSN